MLNTINVGKNVLKHEAESLMHVSDSLDEVFYKFTNVLEKCEGKVIIIGMGKSGHVAKKMAATMSSLGTCAICVHPGECMHGDLGMIQKKDVVILISYSGESDEIKGIIPGIRRIGAQLLGITFNGNSTLAKNVSLCQIFPSIKEACHLGLAPTTSTTIVMAFGDALAIAISQRQCFSKEDFAMYHPAGTLGKKLTIRTSDLMVSVNTKQILSEESILADAMLAMVETGLEVAFVKKKDSYFYINVEDVKRVLEEKSINNYIIDSNIMKRLLIFIDDSSMAYDALKIMDNNHIDSLAVMHEEELIGVIKKKDILKIGITI